MAERERNHVRTVKEFWHHYSRIYILKTALWLCLEISFFASSAYMIYHDFAENCSMRSINTMFKLSLLLTGFLHGYNSFRHFFKIYYFRKPERQKNNLLKCWLVDCFCCVALFCYGFVQVSYFSFKEFCQEEIPNLMRWLLIELIYQYTAVAQYFLTNGTVFCILLVRDNKHSRRV